MKNNTPLLLVGAVVTVLLAMLVLRPTAPRGSAVLVIAALDTSDSVRRPLPDGGTLLGRAIVNVAKLAARLDESRDQLVVFRVDRQAKEFYDETAPRSREKFQWMLIRQTKTPAQPGTFPAKFWTQTAQRAEDSKLPVAVFYAGDADNDDLTTQAMAAMKAAARRLAANSRVRDVTITGANPKNWEKLRTIFEPLRDRFHLQAPDQMNPAPTLERLEQSRSPNESK